MFAEAGLSMNKCPTEYEQMRKKRLCHWLDSGAKVDIMVVRPL